MRFELGNDYCLRKFLYGDAVSLASHADNKEIAINLRDSFPNPYTLEHARAWINHVKNYENKTRFVITYCDEAIGEIGFLAQLDVHRFSAEIGYWLSQKHWGQGVMSKAVHLISQYAFEQYDFVRLFADVVEYNEGSIKLLNRCEYVLEGVFKKNIFKYDKFYDHLIYALYR